MQLKTKDSVIIGKRSMLKVLCLLACAVFLYGCPGSHSNVNVPEDCKIWLTSYYDALKAKDTAKIQELCSRLAYRDTSAMDGQGVNFMRQSKEQTAVTLLQKINQDMGDFKSYEVESCKETNVSADSAVAVTGEGRHIEIICAAKYDKRKAKEKFVLYKGPQDSDFILDGHFLTWEP